MKQMHIPNYLWGEAVRHSTYLLNRIATRTLVDMTPNRTRIQSISLLYPQTRKITVSRRDVVFDETKGWNWSHTKHQESGNDFTLVLGSFGESKDRETGESSKEKEIVEVSDDSDEERSAKTDLSSDKETEHEETNQSSSPSGLRRSDRERVKPKYLEDYAFARNRRRRKTVVALE
ncbi:unnamed protein product [Microthlaspi erraticum]|uniref:Uncharacterized protein n=1 Tax=Microthlaspi erraticum TaxID=1685480 RepID=A0A6D2JBA7_9BRAS|nr:unnamed protein product [Microthlaspi erraticum]